jgi:hypothetical protein
MQTSKRSDDLSSSKAAELAAEISRLETFAGTNSGSERHLLGSNPSNSSLLEKEMRRGPLAPLLEDADGSPQLALLNAKSQLAAYNARVAIENAAGPPPWLKTLVLALIAPLILGILIPPIVNLVTARQQLNLFREQKSLEASRKQADLLLSQLSGLVVKARELKDSVDYFEVEGLSQGQADRLYRKAVELEQAFRLAVQLHSFDSFPDLHKAEFLAFYEVRALEDCLYGAAGRRPSQAWRRSIGKDEVDLVRAVTSAAPCGENFDFGLFESLTSAVNSSIDSRIGGSLFSISR